MDGCCINIGITSITNRLHIILLRNWTKQAIYNYKHLPEVIKFMRKIKVLQVFAKTGRGGAESMVMSHLHFIDKEKFQIDFVNHTQEHCDFDDEIKMMGVKLYHLPRFKIYNIIQYRNAWKTFFKEHPDYDVIHIHYFTLAPIIIPIAKKYGIKIRITHSHNTKRSNIFKGFLLNMFHKRMVEDSTLLLACGKEAGENIFHTTNFKVFNNAIDTNEFKFSEDERNKTREQFGITSDDLLIGHVGSFRDTQKNHARIIKIFKEIHEKDKRYKLVLVGNGALLPQIKKEVSNLGISNSVIFTGVRSDIPNLMSAFDILLFPSLHEGLPVVVVEAQTSGCPVVMSSNVTDEVILTDIVTHLSLTENNEKWGKTVECLSRKAINREEYYKKVQTAGYDVRDNVKILENIYQGDI